MHRYFQRGHERGGYDGGYCSYARRNLKVELESATDAWIDLAAEERTPIGGLAGCWARHIVATVRDADLAPGDRITIVYGDTTWGEAGVEVARVAPTDKDHFHAYVDVTGEREFVELPADELKVRVIPGAPSQFNVVAPAIVRPDQAFGLTVAAMDEFRNRPHGVFEGDVRIGAERPEMRVPGSGAFTGESDNCCLIQGLQTPTEGVHRVTVEPAAGGRRSTSNPIWCTNQDLNLYFGDLHFQSM